MLWLVSIETFLISSGGDSQMAPIMYLWRPDHDLCQSPVTSNGVKTEEFVCAGQLIKEVLMTPNKRQNSHFEPPVV